MPDQQQESLKVYELAKELGLDSFALLDKLKQINIEVKSHMSSLALDQANAIREAIRNERKKKSGGEGGARKRSSGTGASAAGTATTATTRRTVKKAASTSAATSTEGTTKSEPAKSAGAGRRKIIKRRTGTEAEHEAPASAETTTTAEHAVSEHEVHEAEMQPESAEHAAPVAAQAEELHPEVEEIPQRSNAPGTKAIFRTPSRIVEKDELLDEFASRRLKIVQAAPPPGAATAERPTYRTPGAPGTEKKRPFPQKTSATSTEMFQPITSYVQKEEEQKRRSGGGGGTTRGPTPEEIRISDFRKRELVFQPKRKKLPPGKQVKQTEITEMAAHKKKIRIEGKIVVSELAQRMGEKGNTIISKLMQLGVMSGLNQTIDYDTATLIAAEFGWEIENVAFNEDAVFSAEPENEEKLQPRAPIITVMGHVDHGKTSLLDSIRNADVAAGEAGGITQHIGAYSVSVKGKPITFLDTPGHEAFSHMRSRGAHVTDIVILVVAADDSIMPQTKEAIAHAQNAKVPMVVAANKMDKPGADIERIKKDLSANNILVEEWGGEVPLVPVSALKKTGIDNLLETVLLQAEVLDLKADPDRSAEGVVLEARMEKGRGVVADLLVRKGTLKVGDYVVVGTAYGRVRAMMNDRGQNITEVKPAFPAEIFGLNEVPSAGDIFHVVKSESEAKDVAENRRKKALEERAQASAPKPMSLEDLMSKMPTPGQKELNLIVKADVYGTAEAIKESIEKIDSTKVKAKVIQSGVGVITENDVLLAQTAHAIILGFNSKPDNKARDVAKREKVEIRNYSIIYELLDGVREAMEALLEPIRKETQIGKAEVKQVFTVSKLGTVAGSMVVDGKITRNAFARVARGKEVVAEGKVVSLKRFKDDVHETIKGQECGIGVENFEDYQAGDVIHVYNVELVKQTL